MLWGLFQSVWMSPPGSMQRTAVTKCEVQAIIHAQLRLPHTNLRTISLCRCRLSQDSGQYYLFYHKSTSHGSTILMTSHHSHPTPPELPATRVTSPCLRTCTFPPSKSGPLGWMMETSCVGLGRARPIMWTSYPSLKIGIHVVHWTKLPAFGVQFGKCQTDLHSVHWCVCMSNFSASTWTDSVVVVPASSGMNPHSLASGPQQKPVAWASCWMQSRSMDDFRSQWTTQKKVWVCTERAQMRDSWGMTSTKAGVSYQLHVFFVS